MKFYRYLYGTNRMDSYGEIQRSKYLDGFLFDRNITDQSDMVIHNARDLFSGFSVMPGYEKYAKTERPTAIRYAPLYYDGLLRRSDIEPIYAFGVSAEENRGSEGKWAGPSTNRQTIFTQIDFFSAEQAMKEGVYTHLDVLFGIRPMTDEDVRKVRQGEARVDEMYAIDQVLPVLNTVDRNHVLAAVNALYQGKCIAFVLEECVPFNRRAKELLLNVYSLLQPMDAYRTGYSVYQNPKTIVNIMSQWSVKVFVVPGERNPENGIDPTHEIPAGVVIVDMRKPCDSEDTPLWKTLETWLEVPWKQRLMAMASVMKGDNMLLARSDEKENAFWRNEFLIRSEVFFQGVNKLTNWARHADLSGMSTLEDVYAEYAENIQPWIAVPGATDVFRGALDKEAQRRNNERRSGKRVTPLDISKLTADAYADLMLNEDSAREQELEKLYQFGMELTAPDPRTTWRRCASHQESIRQEQVEKAVSQIKDEYEERITGLEAKKAEYSRVKAELKLSEDADDTTIKELIANTISTLTNSIEKLKKSEAELTDKNEILDSHIASLYPDDTPGEDHAARIAELLVAEAIIRKCRQQLNLTKSGNQEVADRIGMLLDSEQKLQTCIETLNIPEGFNQDLVNRIQELLNAENLVNKCCEALNTDKKRIQDPVDEIEALKTKVKTQTTRITTLNGLISHLGTLANQEDAEITKRIDLLLKMEKAYLDCRDEVMTPDNPEPDLVREVRALIAQNRKLEGQKASCNQYLAQLSIDHQDMPEQRIQKLLDAEKTVKECCSKLNVADSDPYSKLEEKVETLRKRSKHLKECAEEFGLDSKHMYETKESIIAVLDEKQKARNQLALCGNDYKKGKLYDGIAKLADERELLVELIEQVDKWTEDNTAPSTEWRRGMKHTVPEKKYVPVDWSFKARVTRFFTEFKKTWIVKKSHIILSFVAGILAALVIVGGINVLISFFKPDPPLPPVPETTAPYIDPNVDPSNDPNSDPSNDQSSDSSNDPNSDPNGDPSNDQSSDSSNDPSSDQTSDVSNSWLTPEMINELKKNGKIVTLIEGGLDSFEETYGQVPLALFSDKKADDGKKIPNCYVLAMTGVPEITDSIYAYLTYGDRCIAVKHSSCTDHSLLLAVQLMTQIVDFDNLNHNDVKVYVRLDKAEKDGTFAAIQEPLRLNVESTNKWLWEVTNCYTGNDTMNYGGTANMKYRPLLVLEGEGWYMAYSDADKINTDADERDALKKMYESNCAGWAEFWYFYETKAVE